MEARRGKTQGGEWEGQGGGGEDRCLEGGECTGGAGSEWRDCVCEGKRGDNYGKRESCKI